MLANYDPDWNIEDLTDTEIYAAIRYLEPDTRRANEQKDDTPTTQKFDKGVVICACLYIAVLVCLAFLWFHSW
jgi:hypothetical protein